MKKDINICPITKFVAWLILGLIVCLIGITNVFADTIDFKLQDYQVYYDNNGSSVSQVGQSWSSSFNAYVSNNITTSANSYGAGVVINSGIPIISGHAYSLSFYFEQTSNIALSSKNRIALGGSVSAAASNYANSNYNATMITSKVVNSTTLQFAFTANSNSQYIFIPWTTTSTTTQTYVFTQYIINDLGGSGGVSESTINNSLNNQTNVLNQSITDSQNAIIQNQNENNEELQNTITDNLNNCVTNLINDSNYLIGSNTRWVVNNYDSTQHQIQLKAIASGTGGRFPIYWELNLKPNTYYTFQANNAINGSATLYYYIYTNGFSDTLFYYTETSGLERFTFRTNSNTTYYIQVYVSGTTNTNDTITLGNVSLYEGQTSSSEFIPYGSPKCVNKLDQQTDAINGINDSINDDNIDSSSWANFFNNFTTNTFGLTSIITAPLNLIQSLTTTSCTDLQLPLPYLQNKYLTLPCMTTIYSQYFGTFFTLYQTITYGIIAYWVCVRIFNLVKDFKNPDHDEIEVVDL